MSDKDISKETWNTETPRGPTTSDGIPDRGQEDGLRPPILNPGDHLNPNDPPLPLVSPIVDGGNL